MSYYSSQTDVSPSYCPMNAPGLERDVYSTSRRENGGDVEGKVVVGR